MKKESAHEEEKEEDRLTNFLGLDRNKKVNKAEGKEQPETLSD